MHGGHNPVPGAQHPRYRGLVFADAKHPEFPGERQLTAHHPEHGRVGHINYTHHSPGPPGAGFPHIKVMDMEVPDEHWRRGVASQMMTSLERRNPGVPVNHGRRRLAGWRWAHSYYGTPMPAEARQMWEPGHNPELGPASNWTLDRQPFDPHLQADVPPAASPPTAAAVVFWDHALPPREEGAAFYHGTYRHFTPGDLIEPGHPSNYRPGHHSRHAYFTTSAESGSVWAYDAIGARAELTGEDVSHLTPRVYAVIPAGAYDLDPANLDNYDQHYQDYRSRHPLRVICEVPYDYDPYPEWPIDWGGDRWSPCVGCADPQRQTWTEAAAGSQPGRAPCAAERQGIGYEIGA